MTTHQTSIKTYFLVYVLLLVGLVATVGVAYLHLGIAGVVLTLLIAFTKAALVVLYFMHVRDSPELNKLAIAAGLVWLSILFGFLLIDYGSRTWTPNAEPQASNGRVPGVSPANQSDFLDEPVRRPDPRGTGLSF
jgi:cytochrome c oxidase subunit IV